MPYTDVLPSKGEIFSHWKDRLLDIGIFIDWGEPSCWACGFHYGAKYDIRRSDAGWNEILAGWEEVPLQRCHIIPRSCGGADKPSNLFLMCRECHDLQPNTSVPEVFFQWARAQNSFAREVAKLRTAFESFGIVEVDAQIELGELICSNDLRSWMSGKIGLHRPQSNYAPRSSRLTPATVVGLAAYYQRNCRT